MRSRGNRSIFNIDDFRGGYVTDYRGSQIADNELREAINCNWRNGRIEKRKGSKFLCSVTADVVRGAYRAKIDSTWLIIVAFDHTGAANQTLRYETTPGGGFAASIPWPAGTAHTLTEGYNVKFAQLGNEVIAVNGVDQPRIIYKHSASIVVDELEEFDTRTWDTDNWYAGQYASADNTFTDDTTDAQSSASTDFQVVPKISGHGCFIGCDFTFNKIKFVDCQAGTNTSFLYYYYGRASVSGTVTWQEWTPIIQPATWNAVGDRTIEFDVPFDPNTNDILYEPYDATATNLTGLVGRYAFRMVADGQPVASICCANLKVQHSEYIRQLFLNDIPDTCAEHKSHMFLGAGNWLRISPRNSTKGWRERDREFFKEGGRIMKMVPHMDYLCILMDSAIWGLGGNSWQNWVLQYLTKGGCVSPRGACEANREIYYMDVDGLYKWDGSNKIKLTKHIQSEMDSFNPEKAILINNDNEIWLSFLESDETFVFDPDTFRLDEMGDGRVSFYLNDYPNYFDELIKHRGADDTGGIYAFARGTGVVVEEQLDTGTCDEITSTLPITMDIVTKRYDFGQPHVSKIFRKVKVGLSDVSATTGSDYYVIMSGQDKYATTTSTHVASAGVAGQIRFVDITPLHTMDGKTISFTIAHTATTSAAIYGLSVDYEGRRY